MACVSGSPKKEVELWLIDKDELLLYRKIQGGKEQILSILNNPDMDGFMCIDRREYLDSILYRINED